MAIVSYCADAGLTTEIGLFHLILLCGIKRTDCVEDVWSRQSG